MITLRAAVLTDLPFLTCVPESPGEEIVARQIRAGSLQVIEADDVPIGLIKTSVLWDTLPFMEAMMLEPEQRGRGHGTRAVRLWEEELARQGFDLAIVSTQKAAAHEFWRKAGYLDCGVLNVREKPAEIFMQRSLTAPPA